MSYGRDYLLGDRRLANPWKSARWRVLADLERGPGDRNRTGWRLSLNLTQSELANTADIYYTGRDSVANGILVIGAGRDKNRRGEA
jgi:hypothetical protein